MNRTQQQDILEYLKAGHTLTGLEALKLFGTMKLASRISELRDKNYNIQDEVVRDLATGKHYKRYWMAEEPTRTEQEEAIAHSNLGYETVINMQGQKVMF